MEYEVVESDMFYMHTRVVFSGSFQDCMNYMTSNFGYLSIRKKGGYGL